MAQVKIYNQETNSYFNINFDLKQAILEDTLDGDIDYYMLVSTNIPTRDGGSFPIFRVRTMDDAPPNYGSADDFNQLCGWYIEYFTVEAQLAQSSSSSSSSSEGYSSSSSSSVGHSSSSSSSEQYSSSSSSSELYSSSSSSSSGV